MNPAPGIVGFAYAAMAQNRMDMLRHVMDVVIAAERTLLVPVLRAMILMWIGRQFLLLQWGLITVERLILSVARPAVIVFLIVQAGSYATYVRDKLFDVVPNAVSGTILSAAGVSTTATAAPAAQFDAVANMIDSISAHAMELNTSWTTTGLANSISIWISNTGAQLLLGSCFAIYLLGQTLMAIVICVGPLVLIFEIFERTRSWVGSWLGKAFGLTMFGIGAGILLVIQLQELSDLAIQIHNNPGDNAATAAAAIIRVVAYLVIDFVTMAALPVAVGFGSAAAGALAGPSMAALRGATGAAGVAGRIAVASARQGTGLSRL